MLNPRAIATLGVGYDTKSMALLGLRMRAPQAPQESSDVSRLFATLSPLNRRIVDRRAKRRRENDELLLLL